MAELAQRVLRALRALNFEQRVAAAAALLLVVSTFGPFSFVEAAEVLLAAGVLALLFARGEGRRFHLPFGDGTIVAAAGIWAAALIVVRLFDRSLGQNLLALACAALLFLAGARERAKRPPDDLPAEQPPVPRERRERRRRRRAATPAGVEPDTETEPLPPPEFEPYRPEAGEQLRLAPEEGGGDGGDDDSPPLQPPTTEDETRPLPPTTEVEPQSAAGRRGRRRRPRS
jgi:hypothetical protein